MPWWQPLVNLGYPGIFLVSLAGASSIIIPIPYWAALLAAGATGQFNPLFLAAASGLGAAVGELVGYGAGYAGRSISSEKYERHFNSMLRIFDRFGVPAIFVFALTPLPDDLLFIPLGLARYSLWKAFLPCVAGKFFMSLIIIYTGSAVSGALMGGWIPALVTMTVLVLIILVFLRIDWEKVMDRFAPPSDGHSNPHADTATHSARRRQVPSVMISRNPSRLRSRPTARLDGENFPSGWGFTRTLN